MNRIPTTFNYPVVYPNGAIVYCETEDEQQELQSQFKNTRRKRKNMKAIMISDKPKWCAKIMNGEKDIEVRKNKALISAIQKLIDKYGYADIWVCCSQTKPYLNEVMEYDYSSMTFYEPHYELGLDNENCLNGKVPFKFRCYKVEDIFFDVFYDYNEVLSRCGEGYYATRTLGYSDLSRRSGRVPFADYLGTKGGYAIYISDLEVFDKPKELSEFKRLAKGNKLDHSIDAINYVGGLPLTKAPQNFVYIEV